MKKTEDVKVEMRVVKSRVMFPKNGKYNDGDFAIVSVKLVEATSGNPKPHPIYGTMTLKGNLPYFEDEAIYRVLATETFDAKYNNYNYNVSYAQEIVTLDNEHSQRVFLSRVLSDKELDAFFEVFSNPIEVLEQGDIKELCRVKGVGNVKADKILKKYAQSKDNAKAFVELESFGLTTHMINKLVLHYEGNVDKMVKEIKANPYILAEQVDGIGFKKADEMALRHGMDRHGKERGISFIKFQLESLAQQGNSFVYTSDIMIYIQEYLGEDYPPYMTAECLRELVKLRILWHNNDKSMIALLKYYVLEQNIAKDIVRLHNGQNSFEYDGWEDKIRAIETRQGWEFTNEQWDSIRATLEHNVVLITGSAGCGKSTSVLGMLQALGCEEDVFAQCALSGRASVNLTDVTGYDGYTIHRLLEYNPQDGFARNKANKLDKQIIILDELSMVDANLFYKLIQAIETGGKLIMLGDNGQLESIGVGNIIHDLIESGFIKHCHLTKVHRQASKSAIITESRKIRESIQIIKSNFEGELTLGELQDLHLIGYHDGAYRDKDDLKPTIDHMIKKYKEKLKLTDNINDICAILPTKSRGSSCYKINQIIQQLVIPTGLLRGITIGEKTKEPYTLYKGDKVINLVNDRKAIYIDEQGNEIIRPIFNGNMGIIQSIDHENRTIVVDFDNIGLVTITSEKLKNIDLGYCVTCHKCLTEDTWIFTNKGLMQLKNLNNGAKVGEFKPIDEDILVYNGFEFERPSNFFNAGVDKVVKVTTKRGYFIEGTLDHRVDTIGIDGSIKTTTLGEVSEGDCLLISKGMNLYGNNIKIPQAHMDFELNCRSVVYNMPNEMTKDFALFLGMMVADGVITSKGISFAKRYKEVVEEFAKCVYNVFGFQCKIKEHKSIVDTNKVGFYKVEISSTHIKKFCEQIGGLLPRDKYVPQIILQAPKEFQVAFLRGVFEDGTVNIKNNKFSHISMTMKEEKLCTQLQMMLLNMGIVGTKIYHGGSFTLFFYGDASVIFKNQIGFISYFKQDRLDKYLHDNREPSEKYRFPHIIKVVWDIYTSNQSTLKPLLGNNLLKALREANKSNKMSSYVLNNFVKIAKDVIPHDSRLDYLSDLGQNIIALPIDKIEFDTKQTYCIEMPRTHQFLQNGFRGWNCQGSGFKYIICGLDNTHYTMQTRELVYTMITRAKKHCDFIFETKALVRATKTTNVTCKNTFLPYFLDGTLDMNKPPMYQVDEDNDQK